MKPTIGIPQAMLHWEFDGALARFVQALGHEILMSPATHRSIFERGKRLVLDELCFPVKVFMGHVAWLRAKEVDRILIPVIVGHENNQVFPCHLRTRLADLAVTLGVCSRERLFSPSFRFDANGLTFSGFLELGHQLGADSDEIAAAVPTAAAPLTTSSHEDRRTPARLRIALLGHPYVVRDSWVNGGVASKLRCLGCQVIEEPGLGFCPQGTGLHFDLAARTLTLARQWDRNRSIDGIIFLLPFNCGPDGDIARHMIETTQTPMLTLVLDELQSDGGVLTRLEAFVDQLSVVRGMQGASVT